MSIISNTNIPSHTYNSIICPCALPTKTGQSMVKPSFKAVLFVKVKSYRPTNCLYTVFKSSSVISPYILLLLWEQTTLSAYFRFGNIYPLLRECKFVSRRRRTYALCFTRVRCFTTLKKSYRLASRASTVASVNIFFMPCEQGSRAFLSRASGETYRTAANVRSRNIPSAFLLPRFSQARRSPPSIVP